VGRVVLLAPGTRHAGASKQSRACRSERWAESNGPGLEWSRTAPRARVSPRLLENLALKEEALDALHEEAMRVFATAPTAAYDLVEAYRKRAGR